MTDESSGEDVAEDRRQCVDCMVFAPATNTNYTLISQRHGWRLTRHTDAAGKWIMEWHCPSCFALRRPPPSSR